MTTTMRTQPTHPPQMTGGSRIMGDLPSWQADKVGFWIEYGEHAPIQRFRMGPNRFYLVTDADIAQHMLQRNSKNYNKEQRLMRIIEGGGEPTLFSTDGDDWLWRRRAMQPAFHRRQIVGFRDVIVQETERAVANWRDSETIDMDKAMKFITMQIIGRTMFNVDMSGEAAELADAYSVFAEHVIRRATTPIPYPLWLPTAHNRQFFASRTVIERYLTNIIRQRQQDDEQAGDLLDMLLMARDPESDQTFTMEQLIVEMSAIVFAGHETTAVTLTWLFWLLTQHQDVADKLYVEIDDVLEGRAPEVDDLANLPYLNQVINETLRMYPAAMSTTREAIADDEVDGWCIEQGRSIFINIIGLHYSDRYWQEPQKFDPERFSADKNHHRFAFLPFLDGPRKCIGEPLSRMEMQLIVARLLQEFRFHEPAGETVELEAGFVLQPKDGLRLTVERRESTTN